MSGRIGGAGVMAPLVPAARAARGDVPQALESEWKSDELS